MSYDISASKFLSVRVIDPWNMLNRCKKEVFLLSIVGALNELMIALKGILAVVNTVV